MGQCSTLPAEGTRPSTSKFESFQARDPSYAEQRHRLRDERQKESLDFNKLVPNEQYQDPEMSKDHTTKLLKENRRLEGAIPSPTASSTPPRQSRDPEAIRAASESPVPMDTSDVPNKREEIPAIFLQPLPPPPECATRTRCYKLNLDSEIIGLSSSQKQSICLGPFSEPPPFLTYSSSEDSEEGITQTTVAIQTAQIFRGITVARDGTILSQNARATRSNRGKAQKKGEKSRQATKIDKAKDLVEEIIATGKAPDSDEPATMVSLVVVGEYDDMKQLVRDGSKKLRDAVGLPDEHLTAVNQPRESAVAQTPSTGISPRKRVSPSLVTSQRNAALQSPEKMHVRDSSTGPVPQSAPPKLKSNPRDTRPGRREGSKMRLDTCSDFMDPRRAGVVGPDGEWSNAWNIWNCGGAGAVSPFQPGSPTEAMVFEGREPHSHHRRESPIATTRAD
uniref:Uncharacterized protein n=1 Tax=Entomoneis paludosa TaxID=265537 RepID=A0A7S2YNC6_9STRA|mmetsp:Transcript_40283/g.83886  ORF Transcript_40283/g.83886 Transcript_40283/m.83886 type:complete len:449 (+) Transcript_40283:394-1740(+)|eukprot:CAMPEP_0172466026 /NCGR_PEP_ID=MMETSP1065-20121228/55044_1 /TAXON_ID=265537 /ORGANISM="Amphiprora paludosa, Strain CCMP125" /LENGTH=448 /DNA_ID=CAMNT_0013222719 /DNA_START=293 /DNA_END=1639 /DNA_ORIENTATION=+